LEFVHTHKYTNTQTPSANIFPSQFLAKSLGRIYCWLWIFIAELVSYQSSLYIYLVFHVLIAELFQMIQQCCQTQLTLSLFYFSHTPPLTSIPFILSFLVFGFLPFLFLVTSLGFQKEKSTNICATFGYKLFPSHTVSLPRNNQYH
jgi:hypothetical protein